jgi:hypothetical protein
VQDVSPPAKWQQTSPGADGTDGDNSKRKPKSKAKRQPQGADEVIKLKGGKQGRPHDDVVVKVQCILSNFEKRESSDKQFFGELYKNFVRTIQRAQLAYHEQMKAASEEESQVMAVDYKRFSAMAAILQSCSKNGLDSPALFYSYKSQKDFLATSPVAPTPFPQWFIQKMHLVAVDLGTPSQFWSHIATAALTSSGVDQAKVDEQQAGLIADKFIGCIAKPTFNECFSTLSAYFGD